MTLGSETTLTKINEFSERPVILRITGHGIDPLCLLDKVYSHDGRTVCDRRRPKEVPVVKCLWYTVV